MTVRTLEIDPSTAELAALQGTWEQIAHEIDGAVQIRDAYDVAGTLTTISGNGFAVRAPQGDLLLAGTFTLDATASPKAITWIDAIGPDTGKQLPASYVLDGDRFVFIAADEGQPRPIVFHTEMGQVMRTFRRCR